LKRTVAALLLAGAVAACSDAPKPKPIEYPWMGTQVEDRATEAPTPADAPSAPANFVVESTIVFVGFEDQPHRWRGVFQGPNLARFELQVIGGPRSPRQIEFRARDRAFVMPNRSKEATELDDAAAQALFARMDLRLVVFTDDEGSTWTETTLADARGSVRRDPLADGAVRYSLVNPEGQTIESLTVRSTFEAAGRPWPAELIFEEGGTVVWTETVDKVRTGSWFGDEHFLPETE
jgi:hypothetical protein